MDSNGGNSSMSTVSAGIVALIMFGLGLYIGNMVQVMK
jgi:hypothetical protein